MNGSLRDTISQFGPESYVGIDLVSGGGVDKILNVGNIVAKFGPESFDIVVSTEMLEHVNDWRGAISNMKNVLKPGGTLVVTTRSKGCPKHGYPGDYWRFEVDDFREIFSDMEIDRLESDPTNIEELPGIFISAVKGGTFKENDLTNYSVYAME
jgi:SAM-dependent methyltransferase